MKLHIDKNEVYIAVQSYLLLKGYSPTQLISQKYTNNEGLLYLEIDVERHDKSSDEVLVILKRKRVI